MDDKLKMKAPDAVDFGFDVKTKSFPTEDNAKEFRDYVNEYALHISLKKNITNNGIFRKQRFLQGHSER